MSFKSRVTAGLFVIVVLLSLGESRSRAEEGATLAILRITDEIDFDAVGNVTGESEIVLPQELYHKVKTLMSARETVQENGKPVTKLKPPRIENVLRYLGITSTAYEVPEVKGEFDDDASTIHVTYRIVGRCAYRHGQWEFSTGRDPELKVETRQVEIKGNRVRMELRARQQKVQLITRLRLNLPEGATNVEFRKKSQDLVYSAPPPQPAENAAARPEMRFDAKPQLMSALYKLYGNPKWMEMWSARSVFHNGTAETLTDYRVRFRIEGYSSWGPWQRSDKVFPGQTVIESFYPVIDAKIAQLKGSTPAQVELEYQYTRPNGEKVSETEAGRTKLLGMNEALWSSIEVDENSSWYEVFRNSPLVLSSFTSATDPVMLDVVGMISKATGGAGASINDEQALLFMGTLYNLLRQNIAYETTPGSWQQGLLHQHLKYGRDVLRSRSGTCVNLSILYASVCEAAGLKAYIVLGPGHAFAGAKLPQSGIPVVVETTGCGGGTKESSVFDFSQARESAYRTYLKWSNEGMLIEVDIAAAREQGVPSPELPDAGVNPLKEWGIQQPEKIEKVILPRLLAHVKIGLEAYNIPYTPLQGRSGVQINFNTPQGNQWATIVQTIEPSDLMTIVSLVPNHVSENSRNDVSLLLSAINTELWHGNLELTKEGSIAYRTSTDVKGGSLIPSVVQNEIQYHFDLMQKHLPDLRKLATVEPAGAKEATKQSNTGTDAAATQHPMVGRWSAFVNDQNGRRYGHGVRIRPDSTYAALVTTSGLSVEERGRWSYENNVLTTTSDQGVTSSGTVRWVNKNRIVFTGESGEVIYDRVVP